MDTLSDLVQAVQDDLTIDSNSTLFPPALVKRAINRSYRKCAGLFAWPELQDAKTTTTVSGQHYYDYPDNWRSNSIWKLVVNSERYGEEVDGSPLTFDDYLNWKTDYPESTDKKWSNQQRRYFFSPTPSASGLDICIWGLKVTTALSGDSDTTVFSYSTPEVNEAIVLEAVAILKSKGSEEENSDFRSKEAKGILITSWDRIRREKAKYEKINPMFNIADMFGTGTTKDLRGRF
jgi:hypothetical protein